MSAPLAVGDVVEVTYEGTLSSQTILSVLHLRVTTAPSGGTSAEVQLLDLANWLADKTVNAFLAKYLLAAANNFSMYQVRTQKIYPARTIFATSLVNEPGAFAFPATTPNLAASIEKKSLTVGRKGIGRLQFGPVPNTQMSGGYLDPGYMANELTDLADTMIGAITAGTTYVGTYRVCLPAAAGGGSAYDLFDAYPKETVRTMHRRTVGLGI